MSEIASVVLYGIPNCDQVKKARAWLDAQGIAYRFHDFKKAGIDVARLYKWQQALGWETLLNRKGTTWRGLPEERRAQVVDAASAAVAMAEQPSLIKRPVVEYAASVDAAQPRMLAGFSEATFQTIRSSSPQLKA